MWQVSGKVVLPYLFLLKQILQFVNNIFYIKIKVTDKLLKNVYTRSSRPEVFRKKDVLERFVKFTGKHLPAPESLFSET